MAYRDYDRDREFRERGYGGKEDEPERSPDRSAGDTARGDRDPTADTADASDLGFRRPDFTERELGTELDRQPDASWDTGGNADDAR